ncbi:hypothetical protein RJ641_001158, partial [Dillenia turbinata]
FGKCQNSWGRALQIFWMMDHHTKSAATAIFFRELKIQISGIVVSSNENTPFNPSDFSQPSGVPGSSSVSQGQRGLVWKQNAGVVQQNQEFSIRNEDFLEVMVSLLWIIIRKRSLHENPVSMVQPQPILDSIHLTINWNSNMLYQHEVVTHNCSWIENFEAVRYCGRDQDPKSRRAAPVTSDRFGLLGLSNIIRMSDPHVSSLALGFDLKSFGGF